MVNFIRTYDRENTFIRVDTTVSPKSASHAHHTHKRLYITLTRSHTTHARFCAARRLDPNSNLSTAQQQSRALAVRTPNILAHARAISYTRSHATLLCHIYSI